MSYRMYVLNLSDPVFFGKYRCRTSSPHFLTLRMEEHEKWGTPYCRLMGHIYLITWSSDKGKRESVVWKINMSSFLSWEILPPHWNLLSLQDLILEKKMAPSIAELGNGHVQTTTELTNAALKSSNGQKPAPKQLDASLLQITRSTNDRAVPEPGSAELCK